MSWLEWIVLAAVLAAVLASVFMLWDLVFCGGKRCKEFVDRMF